MIHVILVISFCLGISSAFEELKYNVHISKSRSATSTVNQLFIHKSVQSTFSESFDVFSKHGQRFTCAFSLGNVDDSHEKSGDLSSSVLKSKFAELNNATSNCLIHVIYCIWKIIFTSRLRDGGLINCALAVMHHSFTWKRECSHHILFWVPFHLRLTGMINLK